jgi:pimeloyl-ACP methyl ester carboxylesterase
MPANSELRVHMRKTFRSESAGARTLAPRTLVSILSIAMLQSSCVLAHPSRANVDLPADVAGVSEVTFPSQTGSALRAWYAPGRAGFGAVLLLHGVGSNRTSMLSRLRFLHARGYAVLAPDFQAAGESPGEHVTFGERESLDAAASVQFLRDSAPNERLGVIGVSMGGAAALVGPKPLDVDAMVLESVYPTFRDAVSDRLQVWLGPAGLLGRAIAPLLIGVVGPEIGVDETHLRPIERIGSVREPVLMLTGSEDQYTPIEETLALFDRIRAPKHFWEFRGAGHEDLHDFAPVDYERVVGSFLAEQLWKGLNADRRAKERSAERGTIKSPS